MKDPRTILDPLELLSCELRGIYSSHGFTQYRMSKFEEYDLYSRHKDFLVSDGVLTFTDTDGRLMALKPDVTLSIVKNTKDPEDAATVDKLFYSENVYRVSRQSGEFREIKQIGLECMGGVDRLCVCEVLLLAAESLAATGVRCALEISHTGFVNAVCSMIAEAADGAATDGFLGEVLLAIRTKNRSLAEMLAAEGGLTGREKELLFAMTSPSVPFRDLSRLVAGNSEAEAGLRELGEALDVLSSRVPGVSSGFDPSVSDSSGYYNGIVFRGFAEGVADRVLSGGQYDALMKKMGRSGKAVGFAVYLDGLERVLPGSGDTGDGTTLLLYGKDDDAAAVLAKAEELSAGGDVLVSVTVPANRSFCRTVRFGQEDKND